MGLGESRLMDKHPEPGISGVVKFSGTQKVTSPTGVRGVGSNSEAKGERLE
jgi:hypothetical protein